jgi:hypothetical protein
MTSTLNPACPLCGLRFASKPLLELHIREDHRPRRREVPGRGEASGIRASPPAAGSLSVRSGLASRPARTVEEVTTMTATRRPRPGRVMSVLRRALRAVRHGNDELMLASEAIICSARAPRSRRPVQTLAPRDAQPRTVRERADRAA